MKKKGVPAKAPDRRPWFGDLHEIRSVIETIRDTGEALRTPHLDLRLQEQLAPIGVPYLREILEHALAPWLAARRGRPASTFERPLLEALDILNVRHAGELDERSLQALEALLTQAHIARLDAQAVSRVLVNREIGRRGARQRVADATDLRKKVRAAARAAQEARGGKPNTSELAKRFGRTPRHIRNMLSKKKRK